MSICRLKMTARSDKNNKDPILRLTNEEMKAFIKERIDIVPKGLAKMIRPVLIDFIRKNRLDILTPFDLMGAVNRSTICGSKFIKDNIDQVDPFMASTLIRISLLVHQDGNEGEAIALFIINKFKNEELVLKEALDACHMTNSSLIDYVKSLLEEPIRPSTPMRRPIRRR